MVIKHLKLFLRGIWEEYYYQKVILPAITIRHQYLEDDNFLKKKEYILMQFCLASEHIQRKYNLTMCKMPKLQVNAKATKGGTMYIRTISKSGKYDTGSINIDLPQILPMKSFSGYFENVGILTGIDMKNNINDIVMFVLLHELMHHVQYDTNMIRDEFCANKGHCTVWQDECFYTVDIKKQWGSQWFNHFRLPWEKHANFWAFQHYMELKKDNIIPGL